MTRRAPRGQAAARLGFVLLPLLGLLLLLVACSGRGQVTPTPGEPLPRRTTTPAASEPPVEIRLVPKEVSVGPLPLRAGYPFTVTLIIHNDGGAPVSGVPVMVHLSPVLETIGYSPFMEVITVTLPTTRPTPFEVPIDWNLAGGEHRLWVQVNRVPEAWQAQTPMRPEKDASDNSALLELMVEPFDAYRSDVCSGRVDLELGAAGVVAEPGGERVRLRIHNAGNQAAYNLPVVVSGDGLSGIGYTPVIPPCGGTAEMWVQVDRPLAAGESIALRINPEGWEGGLEEDDYTNNRLSAQVGETPSGSTVLGPAAYDFSLTATDVESPEQWLVLVSVHNLGTRDAARVPIRIENEAGRKVNDVIPLVQGQGSGVAAIRVGALWKRGTTLTLTVNPAGVKGALPESDRSNNVAVFRIP